MVAAAPTTPQIINLRIIFGLILVVSDVTQSSYRSLSVVASSCIIYSELQRIRIGELLSE
ncbi:hypothetical protein SADUNF_Sadunf08G0006900 [Salix dunnii]|uniref:Uncharacterized protein n=1 Tax=Salix dunnii TaxID=1413687 RepID=A0A835JS45_9ROSI|nr:hypothetical protein SADUNF_Sadunf08G0006900 [Salix dunnii]